MLAPFFAASRTCARTDAHTSSNLSISWAGSWTAATVIVRFMFCAFLCTVLLASSLAAVSARTRLAPADEYFGHSKMSILEMNNRLRDGTFRAKHRARARDVLRDALRTEDAMLDWTRKYPRDPWVAHYWWRLASLYSLVPSDTAHGRELVALERYHRYARAR